jgi:hypothetical protein
MGILLDYTLFDDRFKSRLLIAQNRTFMQQPELQGGSAKTVHIAKFFKADNPACKVRRQSMHAFASHWTYLSFDSPFMKLMTQGKTLSPSFSTRNGTFSTKTRKNLVLKYLGARA